MVGLMKYLPGLAKSLQGLKRATGVGGNGGDTPLPSSFVWVVETGMINNSIYDGNQRVYDLK